VLAIAGLLMLLAGLLAGFVWAVHEANLGDDEANGKR
jgi:hypothetical protein